MSTTASDALPQARPPRPTRVALFATCLGDRYFAEACDDAVRVLRHFGVEVDVPSDQTCCGQPAYNAGHRAEAARMARHTTRAFAGASHVVLPSGSCAGMIRSFYPGLLEDAAAELPGRTWELAEFLVHVLGVGAALTPGLAGRRVAYHHGCHALRELGVRDEPVALLRACGADVVAWDGDTECCGFGGLFSTKFPEVSTGMADRKLDALPPGVDYVTSADGGCLLQLSGRARARARTSRGAETLASRDAAPTPRFVHLATLLREGIGA
jgi:L-lactate dehydrogenase complex protein LldE